MSSKSNTGPVSPVPGKKKQLSPRTIGILIAILLTILALIFLIPRAPAPPPSPDRPETVFLDNAALVSPEFSDETARWLHAIQLFEGIIYIDGSPPEGALQPWTVQTATEWGVGTDKQDRGLVLFIFRDTRTVRAEIGYGLEGALPDVTMKRLLESILVPAFAQGQYEQGLENFIKTVYEGLGGDAEAGRLALEEAAKPNNSWSDMWDEAWKNGARLPPAVWRFYLQGSASERFGVFAFTLPILFFITVSLIAFAISMQMLYQLPSKIRALREGASAKENLPNWLAGSDPRWGTFVLLTPVTMGIFLALMSGAIAVMVFSLAPDYLTRQGKFGGGGVEVIWPIPSEQPPS